MNGDLTRHTFDPAKRYSSVRHQQGRTVLDADLNEQRDIELHDERSTRIDVIGEHGVPVAAPGFELVPDGSDLQITAGRSYVDGIRLELDAPVLFSEQDHAPAIPEDDGLYLAVLDVFEIPVTAVGDPHLREVALGGPDTTTRTKVVWQVHLVPVETEDEDPGCHTEFGPWDTLVGGSTGTLEVRLSAAADSDDPCSIPEDAGYRGLENQCYRVEVLTGNFDPTAPDGIDPTAEPTFVWSRDNGAIIAAWTAHPSSLELEVDRLGPGGTFGLAPGDWVEILDDRHPLGGADRLLGEIDAVSDTVLTLKDPDGTLATALGSPAHTDRAHPRIRRWDSDGSRPTAVVPSELGSGEVTADGWIRLEHGIEVRIGDGSLRPGDFWLIPARTAALPGTADQQLDWPVDGSGTYLAQRPHGVAHHHARLGLVERSGDTWTVLDDCRPRFAPLTDQIQFSLRGGDGQHGRSGHWLPAPIRVGVSYGRVPAEGLRVRFRLLDRADGGEVGGLRRNAPNEDGDPDGLAQRIVTVGADGIAECHWRLGTAPDHEERGDRNLPSRAQQVLVELLDDDGVGDHLPIVVSATPVDTHSLVAVAGEGQYGWPGLALPMNLRVRVTDGLRPLEGAHVRFRIDPAPAGVGGSDGGFVQPGDATLHESGVSWSDGTDFQQAVERTDASGVASVQWTLGTLADGEVQTVIAELLDDAGAVTDQATVFHSTVMQASQVRWDPCDRMSRYLPERPTVQQALDVFCEVLWAILVWLIFLTLLLLLAFRRYAEQALDFSKPQQGAKGNMVFDLVQAISGAPKDDETKKAAEELLAEYPQLGELAGALEETQRQPGPKTPPWRVKEWMAVDGTGATVPIHVDGGSRLKGLDAIRFVTSTALDETPPETTVEARIPLVEGNELIGHTVIELEGTLEAFTDDDQVHQVVWRPSPEVQKYLKKHSGRREVKIRAVSGTQERRMVLSP